MHISQEDVDFQQTSGIFPQLTAVCSEALEVVNKLQYKTDARIRNAVKKSNFSANVSTIIQENLGYNLPVIVFPCQMPFVAVVNTVSQKYYFDVNKDLKDHHLGLAQKGDRPLHALKYGFEKISQGIDAETGAVNTQTSKKMLGRILIGTGVFRFKSISGLPNFTPAELAAFILHEVGHVVDLGQISGWFYYRASLLDNIEKSFDQTQPTKEELLSILEVLDKETKSFKSSVDTNRLKEAIRQAQNTLASTSLSPVELNKLEQAIKVISVSVYSKKVAEVDEDIIRKYSDVVVTKSNTAYRERMADDFAVKYGASAPLNSALIKLSNYLEKGKHVDIQSVPYIFRAAVYTLGALKSLSASLDMSVCDITDGYDGSIDRLQRNITTLQQVFRKDMDDASLDFFIDQVKQMEKDLEEYASQSHVKRRESIFGAVSNLFTVFSDTAGIMSDKVDMDYKNLYDLTESLIKSPLYYQIARVRRLLRHG